MNMPSLNPQKLAELPIEKQLIVLAGLVILLVPGYVSFGYSVVATGQAILLTSGAFLIVVMVICSYYLHVSKNFISRRLNIQMESNYREHRGYLSERLGHGEIDYTEYKKTLKKYRKALNKDWADEYNETYERINKDFREDIYYSGGLVFALIATVGHYLMWWNRGAKGAALAAVISMGVTLTILYLRLTRRTCTLDRKLLLLVAYVPFMGTLLAAFYACTAIT